MLLFVRRSSWPVILLLLFGSLPACSCAESSAVAGRCGDGVVDSGEQCDDGNTVGGDGCSTNCRLEAPVQCGNGIVEAGEQCDDHNTQDGDGCSSSCQSEGPCGNGTIDDGEQCDDGNTADGDGCSASCQYEGVCGNGVADLGEACDDGNQVPYDGCEDDCTVSPESVVCQQLDPLPTGVCEVVPGSGSDTLLVGDVLGLYTIFEGGQVLVDQSGQISCAGCACQLQASDATIVRCPQGVISPGLINAHEHITYAHNMPYTDTGERYDNRQQWRGGLDGHTPLSYSGGASDDRIRWGELRFLLGGTTSMLGSGSATGFVRNLDKNDQEGLGQPPVNLSVFPLGDWTPSEGERKCDCSYPDIDTPASIAGDDAYHAHVAEGIDAYAHNEFLCFSSSKGGGEDLLEPKTGLVHGVALGALDLARMAAEGSSLIWSPRSNNTLYGNTAMVTAAARLGVRIVLGTDWILSGSMNLQRELGCAELMNETYYDGFFSDRQLWWMVTRNAAQAAAVDDVLGTLEAGKVADLAIFDGSQHQAHRAVLDAAPADVALVMRGGKVIYGDALVVNALGSGCETLDVCGSSKRICSQSDIGKTFAALTSSVGTMYPLFFCGAPTDEPTCQPMRSVSVNGSSVYDGQPTAQDGDGDGIDDASDDCPAVFNPIRPMDDGQQADFDLDGEGDGCDPCPLQPGTSDCALFDPNDMDGDSVADASDNCPDRQNTDQADGDSDGKGDVCDPCPAVPNPGDGACPTTIYAVKQGASACTVAIEDALVTGCADANGFFLQIKPGDPDYVGADDSGVYVYSPAVVCGGPSPTVSAGDRVTLSAARPAQFHGQTQLTNAVLQVLSSGEAPPAPVVVAPAQAGGNAATALEAVVVQVSGVLVTAVNPPAGPGDTDPTGEFVVDGVLRVNDLMYAQSPLPTVNTPYASIAGILDYRNGAQKLEPRSSADLVAGAPVVVAFAPAQSFAREGTNTSPTIPTPLTVTLSGPVAGNTFVSIGSNAPGNLVATGGGVTVAQGASSAPVAVDALAQALGVTLTASLNGSQLSADVRVVGAAEQPQVVAVEPPNATVAPLSITPFGVLLDIPAANPGGNTVSLSLSPGTFGSVPASMLVPADQLSAGFDFTAGGSDGIELLTAALFASQATATVEVAQGGALVLNEIDYDQPSTDTDEFVEILNTTGASVDLSGMALVLVNGANGSEYDRIDLSPAGALPSGGYLVVGSATLLATVPPSAKTLALPSATNNVQNGAPDALGILDVPNSVMVDVLSYEGSVTAGNVNGLGAVSFVEGTATSAADTGAGSMIRQPNGSDTDDAATDWVATTTVTPGAINVP